MSQISAMTPKKESDSSLMLRAWSHYSRITSRVFLVIALSIGILCGPAYLLDRFFGTWPLITGIAFVFSLPLSQYLVVRSMQEFVKNNPQD
ncbi:hypothetical protein IPG41_03555 [Candidatus Peregrinibacteria bacterium]|nr:MAG: hypothetical protein IPG41_03555 [Candidatus Peregrinibacteria bacterium]